MLLLLFEAASIESGTKTTEKCFSSYLLERSFKTARLPKQNDLNSSIYTQNDI